MQGPERFSREDSQEIARRRRGRNWAIFLSLAVMGVLFYAIAVVKFLHQ